MPQPGPTEVLTLGVTTTIIPPINPSAGVPWMVEVENLSPWTLTIVMPGQSGVQLAPGMGQLYSASSGPASLTVTPTGAAAASGGPFEVVTNWAQGNDVIPGTFPVVVAPSLAAGYVINTPNLRLVVPETTFVTTGASSESQVSVPLNPTDRSLILVAAAVGSTAMETRITVEGASTNIDWGALANDGEPFFFNPGAVPGVILFVPVYGDVDATLTVTLGSSTVSGITEHWWLLAGPDDRTLWTAAERFQVTTLNETYAPVPGTYTALQVNAASGTTQTLLAAPATGTDWEIACLSIWQPEAATATSQAFVSGHTSTAAYVATVMVNGAIGPFETVKGPFTISEGLDHHNGTTGNVSSASVLYRSVPTGYNPG